MHKREGNRMSRQGGRRRVAAGLLVWSAVVGLAVADGYRNPPEGAAVMGRAGERLTQGDDPSAMVHNPANLLDVKGGQVMPAVTFGYSKTEFTTPWGASESTEDNWTMLPSVYATFPMKEGFAAGVGVHVPYGQGSEWDEDGLLQFVAPTYAEMRSANVTPNFAAQLGSKLRFGAGLDLMWSDLTFKQSLPWVPLPAGFGGPGSMLEFEGDGYGFGGHAGLTWLVTERQRLALTYRLPVSVDYEGDFTMHNPPPPGALPPTVTTGSDFDTTVDFPSVVGLGYGVAVTERVRVEANVEWVEHSRNESLPIDIANNNLLLMAAMGSTDLPQDWDDTWTFGLGADWKLTDAFTLRGGWQYLPTPVPEETIMPSLAESDKNIFAAGVGYHVGRHTIDTAYAYTLQDDVTVDDPRNPVRGEYDFDQHIVSVSYVFAF